MQLSASASFPELLAPAPSGELPVDGLAAAGSGGDFAALVAGLVDAPAGPVTVPAEPEVPAPGLSAEASRPGIPASGATSSCRRRGVLRASYLRLSCDAW